jgi:hypothetical protein
MLFENLVVPLDCEKCEKQTPFLVEFVSHSHITNLVRVKCSCQECCKKAKELNLEYDTYERQLLFDLYMFLKDKYGDATTS